MFGQTFDGHDLIVVGLLVLLEGVLSIDNALVLGILAKRLPKHMQSRALTYGLVGAFVFRIIAIATAAWLLEWRIVKLLGGGYLIYIAVKHFFFDSKSHDHDHVQIGPDGHPILADTETGREVAPDEAKEEIAKRSAVAAAAVEATEPAPTAGPPATAAAAAAPLPLGGGRPAPKYAAFWPTVFVIEMTDIAFAVDSILAAIALVGSPPEGTPDGATHPKLWVVVTGGMLGVILMRFAAVIFIKLLEKFPRFEVSAYLLVIVIGFKLVVDWAFNTKENPHRINFHDVSHPEFWVFWVSMLVCFAIGFIPKKKDGPGFPLEPTTPAS